MNATPPDGPRTPRGRRRWKLLAAVAAAGALVVALLGAGAAGLWHSDTAWQQALRWLPGLQLEGVQGRPMGGRFSVQRLQWDSGDGTRVVVHNLAWDGAHWAWRPHPGAWLGVVLQQPQATRVQVLQAATPDATATRAAPPVSLQWPLELQAPRLHIGSLELPGQGPLTELVTSLHLGAAAGAEHRIEGLVLQRGGLRLAGQAVIGTQAPLPLQAQLHVSTGPGAATPWQADLQAGGPLQRLEVTGRLRLAPAAGASTEGSADLQATLAPFAGWPLLALSAQARDLDLSTLAPGAPVTRLSGRALLVEPRGAQALADPWSVDLHIDNAEPGPWDSHRVPLRSLQVRLQGRPADPGPVDFTQLEAELAAPEPAGRVTGSGQWQGRHLVLALDLQGIQPARLHGAAPPMVLGGQATFRLEGLAAPGAPGVPAASTASAGSAGSAGNAANLS